MEVENLEIIIGTYEEFLLGFKVVQLETEEYILIQSFANHAHNASVRSVAAGPKFMATGSSDETIRLFDMNNRKEAGLLMHHHGNVNCLEFTPNGSHLVSGCENGSIAICRTGSWQLEKLWTAAHKGASVTSFSIHPSGKMMLSVGSDAAIRTWNLVKGRPAFTTHLCKPKEGRSITQVLWSPGGELYAVAIGTRVEVFTVAKAALAHTIEIGHKVTCINFTCDEVLCVGTEEGEVRLHDVASGSKIGKAKVYDGRVRCLAPFDTDWIVTASSEGHVKLWWRKDRSTMIEVCGTKIGARVTCMVAIASDPAEDLLRLKAAATASKEVPVAKKLPPQPGQAYVIIETAEDTENLARAARQAKNKEKEVMVVSDEDSDAQESDDEDNDAQDSDEEESANAEEVADEEDEDSVDEDEESEDEGETEDSDDSREDDGEDLEVPMLDSDLSSDSDDEPSNSKKRKSKIQKVSKFSNNFPNKKAKLVLEKTNGAQRSVKKQIKKNPPVSIPSQENKATKFPTAKQVSVSKKNITLPKSPAVETASISKNKSHPSKSSICNGAENTSSAKKNSGISKQSPMASKSRTKAFEKNSPLSTVSPSASKAARKATKRPLATSSSGAWQTD